MFTYYKDTKGNACRNWGGFGRLDVTQIIGNITIHESAYDFLFDFNRNYLMPFSSYYQLLVESHRF